MGCTIEFGEETIMKLRFNLGLYGSLCMWSMWYGNMEPPLTQPTEFFVIIEEAHVFIPKDEETHAKYWASKIAREGRKFGLGLGVVSQRPRSIDPNVLSQMGSLAIMKIVQEDDQRQISAAAESISKDLLEQLTSLNVGDAILVGQCVNLPSIVHIEEVKEKVLGSDQNPVGEWALAK
ncbi:hypothetical protein LCGC14_1634460, partial [marine sediment metagenome]